MNPEGPELLNSVGSILISMKPENCYHILFLMQNFHLCCAQPLVMA